MYVSVQNSHSNNWIVCSHRDGHLKIIIPNPALMGGFLAHCLPFESAEVLGQFFPEQLWGVVNLEEVQHLPHLTVHVILQVLIPAKDLNVHSPQALMERFSLSLGCILESPSHLGMGFFI